MAQTKLEIQIRAKDEASKVLGGINSKIQGMSKQLRMAGIGMVAAGGAITAALTMSIKKFAEMGDEVAKMSARTGFATESLSEWRHALEICGANLDTLEKGVKKMSKSIVDADEGMATYIRAFDRIGLSVEDLVGLSPEKQFEKIAMAIGGLEDPTLRSATAQDIFGRAGTQLLPLFDQSAEGIAKLRQEAHDLGIVLSEETAKKAEDLNDAMTRVDGAISGLKMAIAEKLVPILIPLIEKVKNIITKVTAWADEHPQLFKMITIVTGAVGALLIPLGTFLILLPMLSAGIATLTAVSSPWLLIIGACILAVGALAYGAYQLMKNWEPVVAFFNKLWQNVVTIFIGIGQAMWQPIKNAIGWIIDYINSLIATLNRLFGMFRRTARTDGGDGGGARPPSRGSYLGPEVVPAFQRGGMMPYTGLAFLHKGETVLPSRVPIVIHNYIELDGRIIGENVAEYIGDQARLQGV